jgi:hypothetical protein
MLYVLIMYCSGLCPDNFPPPNGVLFYTSWDDCQAELKALANTTKIVDEKGRVLRGTHEKKTCAHLYGDKKQFDRLFDPKQLEQLLKEHSQ